MIETRAVKASYEHDGKKLVGYAAVFDSPTSITERGRTFTEVVRRGAFARALSERQDVIATFNHSEDRLLGRTSSGTLTLKEDIHGLRFEVDLPESASDIRELVQRGDLNGASFKFSTNKDEWTDPNTRHLVDVDLHDISVVVHAAYPDTQVSLRSKNVKRRLDLLRKMLPED